MYHRVAEVHDTDPWGLCVTPRHFAEHLDVLRRHNSPMRLPQFVQACENSKLPRGAAVVTFDDGYANNLHNANPLLERYGIPATVFLTTGHIGDRREFWWDELERLLLQSSTLPEMLRLTIDGELHQWTLENTGWQHKQHCSWRAWEEAPSARHELYCVLYQLLIKRPFNEQQKVLDELLAWAGATPAGRPMHRVLSTEEAAALAQGNLIEIGAHTVTHPALSALSAASQQKEIQQSKTYLEQALGQPVTSFAYPYGRYAAETVRIVREAGFSCACTTDTGIVRRHTSRFQLPRLQVLNWDGETFAEWLSNQFRDE